MVEVVEPEEPARPALVPGVASALSPLVRCLIVPDPTAESGAGIATYLVGIDEVAVIDPGPDDPAHVEAIVGASMRERVRWVVATDDRPELSGGAARLVEATDATWLPPGALADRQVLEGTEFGVQVIAAPGPSPTHRCYLVEEERALVAGALLGGVGAPLSDVAALRATMARLGRLRLARILPVSGPVSEEPARALAARLTELAAFDEAVVDRLGVEPARVDELVGSLCPDADVDASWRERAASTVFAHLVALRDQGRVRGRDARSVWKLA